MKKDKYRRQSMIQNLHGERLVDQQVTGSNWSTRYTFSGKEKDEESNYSYFGARYYDSDISIWLTVDPMASKYPSLTPYNYCAGNPIKLVDPNGEEIWIAAGDGNSYRYENGKLFTKDGSEFTGARTGFLGKTTGALDKLSSTKMGGKLIGALASSKDYKLDIVSGGKSQYAGTGIRQGTGENTAGTLSWSSNKGESVPVEGNQYGCSDATAIMGHELSHAYDAMHNVADVMVPYGDDKLIKGEWVAVYRENSMRSELGLPVRTHYNKLEPAISGNKVIGTGPSMLDRNRKPYLPFSYPNIK
jgi:RHS repeat-associated protein